MHSTIENQIGGEATCQGSRPHVERVPLAVAVITLGAAAVILALPMLMYGPMVNGHDTYQHLNYSYHFSQQFWGGEWSPRWLQGMNHGLGSPSLFVYPPFPSYVYSLLQPMARLFHFNPFNAGEFLALLGSGFAAFLWLRTQVSRAVALVTAVLYMLMPYHLAIDFYRRTALSECWAFVWMPLFLYFAALSTIRKRFALLGMAVTYALLISSHLVSAVIFSVIPLAEALILSGRGARIQSAFRVAAGMALGTCISSFYLLPALSHAKNFPVSRLLRPPDFKLASHLVGFTDLMGSIAERGFIHSLSLTALSMIVFLTVCGLVAFSEGGPDSRRRVVFWLAACIPPVFLMSKLSLTLWNSCALLLQAVQYPWRFNIVLCLAAVPIGALFLTKVLRLSSLIRAITFGLVSLVVVTWVISYGEVWKHYMTDVARPRLSVSSGLLVNDDDGWFEAWSVPGLDQASALNASKGPPVRFLGVAGTSDVQRWEPRHVEFQVDSSTGGRVMINQFYYPCWTASLDDTKLPLQVKAAMPEGLLELEVPPGHHKIRAEIPIGLAERAGRWISASSVLLSLMLALRR